MTSFVDSRLKVKAMVDKERNRVVFVECDANFADVLISFITMPMGTIVSLTEKQKLPKMGIGCLNNLYSSVKHLDSKYFRTRECREILMHPRNGVPTQCMYLKIRIDDVESLAYYSCLQGCSKTWSNIVQYYQRFCECGSPRKVVGRYFRDECNPVRAGAFLKGLNRFVISDDLLLMHPSSSSFFLSELELMDKSVLEVREFYIGENEVLNLLKSSLASKEALTQTLLHKNELLRGILFRGISRSSFKKSIFGFGKVGNRKYVRVKLFISKSKKIVCFAEAGVDFVDLVFSFLTIPLGYVLKQMQGAAFIDGCVDNLYNSIEDLDVEYFKSRNEKQMLLNPKIPPKFGYDNQLTGVEEVSCNVYFDTETAVIVVEDPKIPTLHGEGKGNRGFMAGQEMFTVTDTLNVIPISAVSRVDILNKLDVSLSDVQELVVHVGNKEARRLLVASFVSESALTRTFLKKWHNPIASVRRLLFCFLTIVAIVCLLYFCTAIL
ncbi:hypothetical protein M5689_002608 [Euphorbia peplus]|nr:hypothetical protein M5689_002608 [Euphorbia peplus]